MDKTDRQYHLLCYSLIRPAREAIILALTFLLFFPNLYAGTEIISRTKGMNSTQLEDFLTTAIVTSSEKTKLGITKPKKITLEKNDIQMNAVFKSFSSNKKYNAKSKNINKADNYIYDVAAYKLNLLLSLDMIPTTITRSINEKSGVVVFWIENALMFKDVHDKKLTDLDECSYKKQHSIMFVFDILIYNDDRNMGNVLYTVDDCRLWMIDHTRAFRIKNRVSRYLPDNKVRFSEEFSEKLKQLNYPQLKQNIGNYLSNTQLKFIIKRRDLILKMWDEGGKLDFLDG